MNKREHIIPYIQFALNYYQEEAVEQLQHFRIMGLCGLTSRYVHKVNSELPHKDRIDLENYLDAWLCKIRPGDTFDNGSYWWTIWKFEGIEKRVEFLHNQLQKEINKAL